MIQHRSARGRHLVLAAIAAAGVFLAACGSDDDESSSTTAASSEDTAAPDGTEAPSGTEAESGGGEGASDEVTALVEQYSSIPAEIVQTEALSAAPDADKMVAFIVCADPSCAVLDGFLNEAVSSFGWEYVSINAPATDFGSAVQQAIDSGADYIAGTGTDAAAFQPQYDAMQDAGIPYFTCYATDVPGGEENNLYSNCYDASASEVYSKVLVNWIIADSGGAAETLIVNLPAFPILSAQAEGAKAAFESDCPDCGVHELDVTIDDLSSGGVPNAIISFLQSNPDINYVYLTYNGFAPGVAAALESAGMSDVKITGTQATQPQLQAIIDGTEAAWTALPQEYAMWTLADQMARVATGDWSSENERTNAIPPFFIVDNADIAGEIVDLENGWPGPEGFKDAFKELWGV